VGDGADWIATQVEEKFGAQGGYLVDFYHVCDYLSAAAEAVTHTPQAAKVWMAEQKERLKTQRVGELMQALRSHIEPASVEEDDAPVRQCHRYLSNRMHQLDYQNALANDLPIGSGENRKCTPIHRPAALKTPRCMVARSKRRSHAGLKAESSK
jgi:hypothetical protein